MNDREVAEALNVRRQTVCEWRHQPEFQERLVARRRELWGPYVERLQSLIPRAIETIEWQIPSHRDIKLAFQLIELVGLGESCRSQLGLPPPPIHDPVETSREFQEHRAQNRAIAEAYARAVGLDDLVANSE